MFSHHNKTYVQNLGSIGILVDNLSRLQASLVIIKIFCSSKLFVCNCSMFCCMLLYVRSSIEIILMGKRELIALLNLSSLVSRDG